LSLQNKLDKISKEVKTFFEKQWVLLIWCNSIEDWLVKLWERKITSILVEGWWTLLSYFLKQKLYNKISAYIAPVLLWEWVTYYNDLQTNFMKDALRFKNVKIEVINDQVVYNISK
jgi:riboflavin biosynthesis pyrimidine reductase